jgi:hypothetical protein
VRGGLHHGQCHTKQTSVTYFPMKPLREVNHIPGRQEHSRHIAGTMPVTPGVSPQAQQLGGGWAWNHTSNECLTSVQMVMATAPMSSGNCR